MSDDVPFLLSLVLWTFFVGSLVFWCGIGRSKLFRGDAILEFEPRPSVPWGLLVLVGTVFLCMTAEAITLSLLLGNNPSEGFDSLPVEGQADFLLYLSLARVIGLAASLLLLRFLSKATLRDLGLNGRRALGDLKLGVVAFLALAPAVYGIQGVLSKYFEPEHPILHLLEEGAPASFFLIALVSAVIVAPIAEELVFRVFLQGWMENVVHVMRARCHTTISDADFMSFVLTGKKFQQGDPSADEEETTRYASSDVIGLDGVKRHVLSVGERNLNVSTERSVIDTLHDLDGYSQIRRASMVPMFLSSAIFASLHWGQGPAPIPLFFLALGLGYIYQRTHRILPCIVVHMLLNGTTLLVCWLVQGGR